MVQTRRAFLFALSTLLAYPSQGCDQPQENSVLAGLAGEDARAEWTALLECGLMRSHACHSRLQLATRSSDHAPIQGLAAILLEEWELPSSSELLRRPQLVWTPHLEPDRIQKLLTQPILWTLVVVRVEVLTDGSVGSVEVLRPTNITALDSYIRSLAKRQLYRPARERSRYVTAKADSTFRLEPR